MAERSPQQTAEFVRDRMYANDRASQGLGMQVTQIGPGSSTVTMTVREDMLNGHALCHGGLIATLADTAFAFACNAYNERTVASGFSLDLNAPAHLGDVPDRILVVGCEPEDVSEGMGLSPRVARAVGPVLDRIRAIALGEGGNHAQKEP